MRYKMAVDREQIYMIYMSIEILYLPKMTEAPGSLGASQRMFQEFWCWVLVRHIHLWPFVTGGCAVRKMSCCLTSTETIGLLGMGAQDIHLDFHTAPELWKMGQTSCRFFGGGNVSEVASQTVCYSISFCCVCVIGLISPFCSTRIFMCQWHLNVHRNLSWWRSVHMVH